MNRATETLMTVAYLAQPMLPGLRLGTRRLWKHRWQLSKDRTTWTCRNKGCAVTHDNTVKGREVMLFATHADKQWCRGERTRG